LEREIKSRDKREIGIDELVAIKRDPDTGKTKLFVGSGVSVCEARDLLCRTIESLNRDGCS